MYGFDLKTEAQGTLVVQELSHVVGFEREVIIRQVLDVADKQVRDALIAMGWTPPQKPA